MLHFAQIIGVRHNSSQGSKLTFNQVLETWRESQKSEPLKDYQGEEQLCQRLDDGGFKTFSSKLHHGNGFDYNITRLEVIKRVSPACSHTILMKRIIHYKLLSGSQIIQEHVTCFIDIMKYS